MTIAAVDLTGRTALVTGATGGLGRAIAHALAKAGARLLISGRTAEACQTAAAELGAIGRCSPLAADIASPDGVRALADQVSEEAEQLDILVNNAGTAWAAPFEAFPVRGWDKVMDLNLRAPFLLTQALVPLLESTGSADAPARVVNIGSMEGLRVADRDNYSYAASKAGLHHLTRVLARELGPRHVTVNAVAPGIVETRMTSGLLAADAADFRARTPLGRLGRPEEIAAAVCYLAGPGGAFVTGAVLPVDGGLSMTL
ncbi:NAD(P)-dependent dehydrogenase (short-subunit alcohol dehydrogenase family) [Kribbella sp. VKM Ac-2527]|uniref:NAD(P)-dependent dehydrogenase (Short-subunit alcohol dehydrogenase family) n=1 Tax=Kribbella caucasensis TaxID=2512215 RepID=A0A4R6KHQ1_9ACTN|nr:SDR family oxidoreductase [Kribbella sp. VKM Ac-2527]TDO50534.1 NAD(P)-dependent dehydrogenase (short-subunit alcohol dehydrogenase family) [Kribbella sp. VKM Ac-2527]